MPNLNYYVSATEGRYGVMNPIELDNGRTFGSQGATVCVILLLIKSDGNLFCGHMSCGIAGIPGNKQIIKDKAGALLDNALGDGNKGQSWWITGSSTDNTNVWIREAMHNWFTNLPTEENFNNTDGYFRNDGGNFTVTLSNDMGEEGATEVYTGNFNIEP